MKLCYIIGAGELPLLYIKNNGLIIAADGGLSKLGDINPDVVVGDFDSLGFIPNYKNTVVLPTEKDVTDMRQAVDIGFEKGADTFVLYGGTGGRPDHTFANYALLSLICERGRRAYLVGEGFIATVIENSSLELPEKPSGTLSVFALEKEAKGVTLKGVKYLLNDHTLTFGHPLGVSNSFMGEKPQINVKNGKLLIMWEENNLKEFIDNLK